MFLRRALVTFTLGPLALYVIVLGGLFYFVPITLILLLAAYEYDALMAKLHLRTSPWLLLPAVLLLAVAAQWPQFLPINLILLVSLFVVMCYVLWNYERRLTETAPLDWLAMSAGVILLGWLGGHFLLLRGIEEMAWEWTMVTMLGIWIADSGAYLVGRFLAGKVLLGKHPLSPRLSPNKTVEGYVGGIVLGTLISVALANYLQLPLLPALLLGLVSTTFSPAGDLAISLLKREAGVKDSGRVFSEQGGALDRIDSLVWSVGIAYYLINYMG